MQLNKQQVVNQHWKYVFFKYINSPHLFLDSEEVFQYTEEYVIVKDKFPKSKVHYLILPRHHASALNSYLDIQSNFAYYDALFTNAAQKLIQWYHHLYSH